MCAESNGANFMKNIDHKWSYDHFYSLFLENELKFVLICTLWLECR